MIKIGSLADVMNSDGMSTFLDESKKANKSKSKKDVITYASRYMQHLIYMAAYPLDDNKGNWNRELDNFISGTYDALEMEDKYDQPNKNILKELDKNMDKAYNDAIRHAKNSKEASEIKFDFKNIPKERPWTTEDILFGNRDELVSKIKK